MGFFSDLFGGGQRSDIEAGRAAASNDINSFYGQGRDNIDAYYNKAIKFLEPQLAAGQKASGVLQTATGLNGSAAQKAYFDNYQTSPGFQAKLDAGNRNIESEAAAKGYMMSGRALKELRDYGHGMLNDDYNKNLDRIQHMSDQGNQMALGAASLTNDTGKTLGTSFMTQGNALAN